MIFDEAKLSAWITDSEGIPLPEYELSKTGNQTIECWVPSEDGSNFQMRWEVLGNPHPGLDLLCRSSLDGIQLQGQVHSSKSISRGLVGKKSNEMIGPCEARLFQFQTRMLTDKDDGKPLDKTQLDNLNTIRLEFKWGRSGKSTPATHFNNIREPGPVNERAVKKGHAGSAGLGQTRTVNPTTSCTFTPDPSLPTMACIFRYASREWLKAREIIPYSPKPESPNHGAGQKHSRSSSPSIIDIDDLETDEEEVAVVKHMVPAPIHLNKRRKIKDEPPVEPKSES